MPMPTKSTLPPTCPDCCAIDILQGRNSVGGYCGGCASARHRVYEEPERIIASACVIMSTGQRFFGKRHCDCFAAMPVEIDRVIRAGAEQGFLTSRDRFVTREEAAYIALQSEQLKGKLISPDSWLTSEDLW